MPPVEILIVILVFTFGGFVKGLLGIGLPALLVGCLTFLYEPRLAVAMILFPILTTNIRQALRGGKAMEIVRRFRYLIGTGMLFIFLTALVGKQVPVAWLQICVGIAMALFAISGLLVELPRTPERLDKVVQVIAGLGSGILGGLTAIWGPPMAMYLMSLKLERRYFIQVLGVLFASQSIPLTFGFFLSGELDMTTAILSAAMLAPTFAGMYVGEKVRDRIDTVLFFRLFLGVFLLLGLNLIRRGLFGG